MNKTHKKLKVSELKPAGNNLHNLFQCSGFMSYLPMDCKETNHNTSVTINSHKKWHNDKSSPLSSIFPNRLLKMLN